MRRRELSSILFAIASFPVDYLVFTLFPDISTPIIAATTVVLVGVAVVLYIADRHPEVVKPVLDLQPLPHYKGWGIPPPKESRKRDLAYNQQIREKLPEGPSIVVTKTTEPKQGITKPEARLLSPSQYLVNYAFNNETGEVADELIVKFGVVRVKSLSGTVKNCRAQVRQKRIEENGRVMESHWIDAGYVNWYSPEKRKFIMKDIIGNEQQRHLGLNKFLENMQEEIPENDFRDLQLFYMIKGIENVFLCSTQDYELIGTAIENNPVKFETEIVLTGDEYAKTVWNFRASVKWDDFEISKI